jgi:hypothetical protein
LKGPVSGMEGNGSIGTINIHKIWSILSTSTLTGVTTGLVKNTMKLFITNTTMVRAEDGNSLTKARKKNMSMAKDKVNTISSRT